MKKINDENIIQLRISLANVEPIKIPSNWKADIDIKGVTTTNPHNPNVKSLNDYEKVAPTIIKDIIMEGLEIAGMPKG